MTEKELMLTSLLDCRCIDLYVDSRPLSLQQERRLEQMLLRRQKGEPLQYIIGRCEFFDTELKVDSRVLIPRHETELLVEAALKISKQVQNRTIRILDMGTGSGNIAIALAKKIMNCEIFAVDISLEALELARDNAQVNGVGEKIKFIQSDLFIDLFSIKDSKEVNIRSFSRAIKDHYIGYLNNINLERTNKELNNSFSNNKVFDMIISNPPYIPTALLSQLPRDVQWEPKLALDGGRDGLSFYKRILDASPAVLRSGAVLLFEMGDGQNQGIRDLVLKRKNFRIIDCIKDYAGLERIIVLEFI